MIEDPGDQKFTYQVNDKHVERLWKAISQNNRFETEKFFDFNEVDDSFDQTGQTLLHLAADRGFLDMLMLVLSRTGVKADVVNQQLATPMHMACRRGHLDVVKFLISTGVDVNIQDEHG